MKRRGMKQSFSSSIKLARMRRVERLIKGPYPSLFVLRHHPVFPSLSTVSTCFAIENLRKTVVQLYLNSCACQHQANTRHMHEYQCARSSINCESLSLQVLQAGVRNFDTNRDKKLCVWVFILATEISDMHMEKN